MFAYTPRSAILPVREIKRAIPLPADTPDRFAVLLARLAQRDATAGDDS